MNDARMMRRYESRCVKTSKYLNNLPLAGLSKSEESAVIRCSASRNSLSSHHNLRLN
jgi:hypothetical protein